MEIADLLIRIQGDASGATAAFAATQSGMSSITQQAAIVGGAMTAGVTLPLVGIATAAVSTAAQYQQSMNVMQAVTGANAQQMGALSQKAIDLGADMSLPATSANDAANAMTELGKAGLSVDNILTAAKGTLQLAAAGNMDEARAAEISANALNMFGLKGGEATRVADLLAASANASSAEVSDMGYALTSGGAAAAQAKIPIEDYVTALGELANNGIKGEMAGAGFRTMLLRLENPTKDAKNWLDQMNISLYDQQGHMRPLPDLINQFSTAAAGMTDAQIQQANASIFGSRSAMIAKDVLEGGLPAYNAMHEAVTKQGAAATLAGARMQGLAGAFEGLKSQIETLLLTEGMPFLNTLEGWVRGVADFIPKLSELNPNIKNLALGIGIALAAAGPLLLIVTGLSMAFGALLSPIGLIVIAIAALGAAFATNFLGIRDIAGNLLQAIGPIFQQIVSTVQGLIPQVVALWNQLVQYAQERFQVLADIVNTIWGIIVGFFQQNGSSMLSTFQTTLSDLLSAAGPILQAIQTIFMTVFDAIRDFLRDHATEIQGLLTLAWQTIQTVIQGAMVVIQNIIVPAFQAIAQFISDHATEIKGILNGAWTIIKGIVQGALEIIQGIVHTITALIKGDWQGVWEGIKQIAQGVWDAITGIVQGALTVLQNLLKMAYDAIKPLWDTFWANLKQSFVNMWNWITTELPGKLQELANNISSWANRTANDVINWVKGIGQGIVEGVKKGITDAWGAFTSWIGGMFQGAVDGVKNALGIHSPSTVFAEIGANIMLGLQGGMDSNGNLPVQSMQRIAQAIMQAMAAPVDPGDAQSLVSMWRRAWDYKDANSIGKLFDTSLHAMGNATITYVDGSMSKWKQWFDVVSSYIGRVISLMSQMPDTPGMPGGSGSGGNGGSSYAPSGNSGQSGGNPFQAFASGGIVTQPTYALIGEAGPEAVVPLGALSGLGAGVTVQVFIDGIEQNPRTVRVVSEQVGLRDRLRSAAA